MRTISMGRTRLNESRVRNLLGHVSLSRSKKSAHGRRGLLVSSILATVFITSIIPGCSVNKAEFGSEVKASEESMAVFGGYESVKGSAEFKQALENVIKAKIQDRDSDAMSIKINDTVFPDYVRTLKSQTRILGRDPNKDLPSNFTRKKLHKLIENDPVSAIDFELNRQILLAQLAAGQDKSRLQKALSQFTYKQHLQAARAGELIVAMGALAAGSDKKRAELGLLDWSKAIAAGSEFATALLKFFPTDKDRAEVDEKKVKTAIAALDASMRNLYQQAVNNCIIDSGGIMNPVQNYNVCSGKAGANSLPPTLQSTRGMATLDDVVGRECTHGIARDYVSFPDEKPWQTEWGRHEPRHREMLAASGINIPDNLEATSKVPQYGNSTNGCQDYTYYCTCSFGWDYKTIRKAGNFHDFWWKFGDSDGGAAKGCGWHFSNSNKAPEATSSGEKPCESQAVTFLANQIKAGK